MLSLLSQFTGGGATGGDSSMPTANTSGFSGANNQTFGGVVLGDTAVTSPTSFTSPNASRRYGATAPTSPPDAMVYTSTVSASPVALVLGALAVGGLLLFGLKRKG